MANTSFVKELNIYRSRKNFYKVVSIVLELCIITSLVSSLVLVARPAKKETVNNGTKKRDIFLCMDVSYSLYELNYELADYLEQVVSELKGDRFGITIFNTSSVVFVPMTDDYDYVVTRLEELKEYFEKKQELFENLINF